MHDEVGARRKAVLIALLLAATFELRGYFFLVLLSLLGLLRDEVTLAQTGRGAILLGRHTGDAGVQPASRRWCCRSERSP